MRRSNRRNRSRSGQFVRARRARRNPPRGGTHRRRPTRRIARRNPPRPKSGQKGYKTPEATRRKISLAVKRAMAARKSGGGSTARRPSGRRRVGGSRGRGITRLIPNVGGARGALNQMLSSKTLKIAGGAIGAGFLTSYIVNRFGARLPGIESSVGRVCYRALFPLVGALAVRRFDRDVSDGFIVGGAVSAINEVIRIMAGSPASVPVIARAGMPVSPAGLVGSGGRGRTFNAYAGDELLAYGAADGEFAGYDDEFGDYADDADEFGAYVGADNFGEWE